MTADRLPPLAETFAGKKLLVTGATGFLGKVFLSALLKNYPEVEQVVAIVRAADDAAAQDRFVRDVIASPAFDPLREEHGVGLYDYVTSRVTVYQGDLIKDGAGLSDETRAALVQDLDLVVHCAGLVEFVPPLDKALDINVKGTLNCLELARAVPRKADGSPRCGFVHVSTCFVCGTRPGVHPELLDVHDYPKRTHSGFKGFDAAQELAIARRLVEEIRNDEANDPAVQADLWEAGGGSKRKVKRLVDMHVRRRMVEVGIERAQRWGWPNTYTYSKALAERLAHEAADELAGSVTVRPAVVESALSYPFPGWNQGINTSAPLVWMTVQGQRYWPTTDDLFLDVIPVDFVAHGLITIAAATLRGDAEEVYQLGTSDANPFAMRRVIELASLAYRDRKRPEENPFVKLLDKLDLEAVSVPRSIYERTSLPGQRKLARKLKATIDRIPTPEQRPRLAKLLDTVKSTVKTAARELERGEMVMDIYLPFIESCPVTFRCDNARRLHARLDPADRERIPYSPESLDWRTYWKDIHIPGLERWAFPQLRLQAGGSPTGFEPEFDSLTALFEDRARFGRIVLWRRLNADGKVAGQVTYEGALARARAAAGRLIQLGVEPGDRVVLLSENAPEWGLGYFATLFAGATSVPIESGVEAERLLPLIEASGAKVALLSLRNREGIGAELERLLGERPELGCAVRSLEELTSPRDKAELLPAVPHEGDLVPRAPASLIYTSGTTGAPKGVLLSHRAFCTQVRALASVFQIATDDSILSVLPLHHCFEFSAGFLLPLYGGSTVTYLHETTAESIRKGMETVKPTAMIGVPALFDAWYRKVRRQVKGRGPNAERAYEALLAFHRGFRARTGLNLGRRLFGEVHDAFGGQLRFAVSGGAALSREVALEFEGLGLDLFEGHGLSEAGPVVSAARPGAPLRHGSVGQAVPGVELRIHEPDGEGVGEIVVRSPSLFSGYDGDLETTARTLRDGWLHTGDLGRLDEEDVLYVVGRLKDAIVDASGNTVHPDEVEDLYAGCPDVSELAVAGVPAGGDHDQVAALVVARNDVEGGPQGARERIREFVSARGESLPFHKRIKVLQFTTRSLPRTQTRKVRRGEVARLLLDLTQAAADTPRPRRKGRGTSRTVAPGGVDAPQIFSDVAGVDPALVVPTAELQDLGLDSIALAELALALSDATGRPVPRSLAHVGTVGQLLAVFDAAGDGDAPPETITADARPVIFPDFVQDAAHTVLDAMQEFSYGTFHDSKVIGRGNIPHHTTAIVVANHCSHLDVGLVKYALGEYGREIISAGARDYFFKDTARATYFHNCTHVVPFDRHESVRESLQRFVDLLRQGKKILIFPEGTRSVTGRMASFKPGLGLLVQASRTGILPVYLSGTHKSMPKGTFLPRPGRLEARIGPFLPPDKLLQPTPGLGRRQQANRIVALARSALCALRDGVPFDPDRELATAAAE